MLLHTKYLSTIATSHPARYALNQVQLENRAGSIFATATDGRRLARITLELEDGETLPLKDGDKALIPLGQWMRLEKGNKTDVRRIYVNEYDPANPTWCFEIRKRTGALKEFWAWNNPMYDVGEFPRVDAAIPHEDDCARRIRLNPTFLVELAKALGSAESIELQLHNDGGPMRLIPNSEDAPEGIAVLMPIVKG